LSRSTDLISPDVLAAWGSVTVTGPLGGGNRNSVLELRRGRERLVARRSRRPPASLDWEVGLLDHLARHGLRVPSVIPARDGRRHVDGVVVLSWLDGHPPRPGDWPAVAAALRKLHAVTAGWPQRPGFASTEELITAHRSGDADLSIMPPDAVADCRAAWRRLAGTPMAVVHGDPGPANIRMTGAGPGLLDWDEARVDYTDLDLADLPASDSRSGDSRSGDAPAAYLPPARLAAAHAAVRAWEAASGWRIEPSYARRQLAELRSGPGTHP